MRVGRTFLLRLKLLRGLNKVPRGLNKVTRGLNKVPRGLNKAPRGLNKVPRDVLQFRESIQANQLNMSRCLDLSKMVNTSLMKVFWS